MAKIKPAGSTKRGPAGPKNPGAVGCLILIGSAFILVTIVLYLAMSR